MLYIVFDCGIIFREIEAQQIEVGRAEAQARLYLFNNPEPESDLSQTSYLVMYTSPQNVSPKYEARAEPRPAKIKPDSPAGYSLVVF
jgi:hypothetical protein